MKTLKSLILLVTLILVMTNCEDKKELSNLSVERYVELLKANQYDSNRLPAFTYNDIPALLKYRNESQLITNFPQNPISSLYNEKCTLGIYVLWTIESIRLTAINSPYLIMGFPSQNPILALRDLNELKLVSDEISHQTVSKAYYDWWENNKNKNFNESKNIDPLQKTKYKWH